MAEYGLTNGTIELGLAGPITFGPEGILFVADNSSATVYAVDTGDQTASKATGPLNLDDLDVQLASFLGSKPEDILIRDLTVNPVSQNIYLSVQRGMGDSAAQLIVRVDRTDASIEEVTLDNVPIAHTVIADAPAEADERLDTILPVSSEGEEVDVRGLTLRILRQPIRKSTITDLAYVDGTLFVAGLSNEEFSSKLRRIPFPFNADPKAGTANNLEIYHVDHGKWETAAPIRAFVPYDGGRSILATYTCSPLVHFPVSDLKNGTKTVGRTVAELGPMNQPLDMISFFQNGAEQLLIANSRYGLIKVATADVDTQEGLTEPHEPIGVPRQVEQQQGVRRLANLGDYVLALQADDDGRQHLRSL
ncbi:MAG TPA: hypothetical protein VGM94_09355, partial [Galbitalea sp.]